MRGARAKGVLCSVALTLSISDVELPCLLAGRHAALMRCRGGLSMGAQATPAVGETDLLLRFRSSSGEPWYGSPVLAPGYCGWVHRLLGASEPHVVVFPLNGPLAVEPYPIGHQARACAADTACTMEFCAYHADGELRAVDGLIRLAFGGRN